MYLKEIVATSKVKKCARCGEDHERVEWHKFDKSVWDEDGEWTHWGQCPTTCDPIMMRFEGKIR